MTTKRCVCVHILLATYRTKTSFKSQIAFFFSATRFIRLPRYRHPTQLDVQ